jgi:hypothetical protein
MTENFFNNNLDVGSDAVYLKYMAFFIRRCCDGTLGGWIESEKNLEHGDAWVSGNAIVSGNARVSGRWAHCMR